MFFLGNMHFFTERHVQIMQLDPYEIDDVGYQTSPGAYSLFRKRQNTFSGRDWLWTPREKWEYKSVNIRIIMKRINSVKMRLLTQKSSLKCIYITTLLFLRTKFTDNSGLTDFSHLFARILLTTRINNTRKFCHDLISISHPEHTHFLLVSFVHINFHF